MYNLKDINVWMPRKDNAPSTRKQKVVVLSADLTTVLETFYIDMKFGSYTASAVKELDKRFGRNGFYSRLVHGKNLTDIQFQCELKNAVNAINFSNPDEEYQPQLMSRFKFDLILACLKKKIDEQIK